MHPVTQCDQSEILPGLVVVVGDLADHLLGGVLVQAGPDDCPRGVQTPPQAQARPGRSVTGTEYTSI